MESLARIRAACSRLAIPRSVIGLWASGMVLLTMPLAASPISPGALLASGGPPLFFYSDSDHTYAAQGHGWRARFAPHRVTFSWTRQQITLELRGASPRVQISPGPATGTVNFLQTAHPARWQRQVPLSQMLTYRGLYPGIDLTYRGEGTHLKSEFVVSPGADPRRIRFAYRGLATLSIDSAGTLVVAGPRGTLREQAPLVYQDTPHGPVVVTAQYRRFGSETIGFALGTYDHALPLVIDPDVSFSTLWGGSQFDALTGIAIGPDGSLFVCGWTESSDVPVSTAYQSRIRNPPDAFVMKLNAAGTAVRYATYLGGTSQDRANAIAVDSAGSAYVTGVTASSDFPVLNSFQPSLRGYQDAFVTKLSADGASLVYSTYLGGEAADIGNALQVDASGNAYVAGQTLSLSFPVANALRGQSGGQQDAFITKLSAAGNSLIYSTYLGGSGNDQALGLALLNGQAYVVGATDSPNFPVLGAFQSSARGGQDAFVAKLAATGSTLVYSTYLGGSSGYSGAPETATGIAVNSTGEAYIVGMTSSTDFPVATAVQPTLNGSSDAFLTKLNAAGSALVFSTFLGGSGTDQANGVALDGGGNIFVTGSTYSWDFPLSQAVQTANAGLQDAFLVSYAPAGSSLRFSTFWGGSGADEALAVAIDSTGSPVFVGRTLSYNFPLKSALQSVNGGGYGGFLTRFTLPAGRPSGTGVFRNGLWLTDNNLDGAWTGAPNDKALSLGQQGDTPVVADWNGDGHQKAGVFRDGFWIADYNGNFAWDGTPPDMLGALGQAGDLPVYGDWSGDGKVKIGIFRKGMWLLDYNGNGRWDGPGVDRFFYFGGDGDTPVVGDWTGDGKVKIGTFRNGLWMLDINGNFQWDGPSGGDRFIGLGGAGDTPIVGDWNGDGKSKAGIFNAGLWALDYNGNFTWDGTTGANPDRSCTVGQAGDQPVIGDWNGDGRMKIGIFRAGFWVLDYNGNCAWDGAGIDRAFNIGQAGDIPIVGKW